MFSCTNEDSATAAALRRRMSQFYSAVEDYTAFAKSSSHPAFWEPIKKEIAERVRQGKRCRVLELGAGRTGFADSLGPLRTQVEFHAQDITDRNRDYLVRHADKVFFQSVEEIEGSYDVVFSTFAWEHVGRPRATLSACLRLLASGGSLYIVSPRYDFPGYIPPSARHYTKARQAALAMWLAARRLRVALGGGPAFLVHAEPACLSRPWYRDADAIHWVSRLDLRAVGREYQVEDIDLPASSWRQRAWQKCALLFVRIRRR